MCIQYKYYMQIYKWMDESTNCMALFLSLATLSQAAPASRSLMLV